MLIIVFFFLIIIITIFVLFCVVLGSTPVIVYVESAAGIKDGGRTGLSACVISILFFISVFLAPVFSQVPPTATAPVSVLIGVLMMSHATDINWDDMSEAIPRYIYTILL